MIKINFAIVVFLFFKIKHKMKVLMVCLGNICRSPLAEGILKHQLEEAGILDWEIDSAGTGGWHAGELPDRRSIQVAKKHGVDITYQKARKLNGYDLENFDLIFAMDSSNYNDIIKQAQSKEERDKVKLIMNELTPHKNQVVPDPYYDDNGFEEVFKMLDKACAKIIEHYR
jgi:protein-tyrosine phosphatase